jgi:hypothetical protein
VSSTTLMLDPGSPPRFAPASGMTVVMVGDALEPI